MGSYGAGGYGVGLYGGGQMVDRFVQVPVDGDTVDGATLPRYASQVTALAGEVTGDGRWHGRMWADQATMDTVTADTEVVADETTVTQALNTHYGDAAEPTEWRRRLAHTTTDGGS